MKLEIEDLFLESQIKITDNYLSDVEIIKVNDQVVGTLGNISACVGKAKSRKGFNLSMIAAKAINNSIRSELGYSGSLPNEKETVILIDTEQGKYHCYKELDRIIKLASLSNKQHPINFLFLALRKYNVELRKKIIFYAIQSVSGVGIVIIDGVRDLVYDINDSKQCGQIINELMALSEKYNIHIHLVLHQNKDSNTVRGHLGTELVNKSESVIEVSRSENGHLSIVKPLFSRNKEFDEFAFFINNDGLPELDESYVVTDNKNDKFTYQELSEQQHRQILSEIFKEDKSLGYSELITQIKEGYSKYLPHGIGDNKAKSLKLFLENKRMILKEGKLYKFNPDFVF